MKIENILNSLEEWAPLSLQENYDNCGLLIGDRLANVEGILISLDCTEDVILEAINKKCNLIIAHHPVLFKPIKSLTGKNYVERSLLLAIKNDIAIYALHTNLDNVIDGVNGKIANILGLEKIAILNPKANMLKKLVTFVPDEYSEVVSNILHTAGAGKLGNYAECSFTSPGTGTFTPNKLANPAIGSAYKKEYVPENRIEFIFPAYKESSILKALREAHPYEEPAFDIFTLDNSWSNAGSGLVGILPEPMSEMDFLVDLKQRMNLTLVRHTPFIGKNISKVALCGGSGSFLLQAAKREQADVFISSDFKYHEFFDADNSILIADINHYEAEVFTKDLIYAYLIKKFSNIAFFLSDIKTNPISYL